MEEINEDHHRAESGFAAVLVDRENIERVRELGKIRVALVLVVEGEARRISWWWKGRRGDGS